ncbi:uncharacterized protein [Rutidosis leptorrhynchoides]|uniref:uncharacterized protein n=1 Tax=Rutidosis leptorrhynchoides TaxID=125765 RepID=UPI003A997DEF
MVIISDDYEKEKGVSHVSSTVTDPLDSKTLETSQSLNAGIEEKSVDEDPEVVESSSKKKKKKKNRGRKNTDSGSSSQNTDKFPKFDLDDYPLARNHDLNMMTLLNDYNRRNHDVISGRESGGFDKQMDNLGDTLWSVVQMLRAETRCGEPDSSSSSSNNHNDDSSSNNNNRNDDSSNNKKKKIWCPRCHQMTRRCRCP